MKAIFNYCMITLYLLTGLFLLIFGWLRLSPMQNKGVGILLICYGLFRAFRVWKFKDEDKGKAGDNSL